MALTPLTTSTSSTALSPQPETARKAGLGAPTSDKADKASFSNAASALSSLAGPAPELDNGQRIAELRAKIADGSYQPNSQAIAGKLLQEAWMIQK